MNMDTFTRIALSVSWLAWALAVGLTAFGYVEAESLPFYIGVGGVVLLVLTGVLV